MLDDPMLPPKLVLPADSSILFKAYWTSSQTLKPFSVDVRIQRPDGAQRWMRTSATPRKTPDGYLWNGWWNDVTEEVERRVAHTVLRLGNQSGKKEPGGIRIDFPVSKQDIAEMTGTTLHTVSRILTAWEAAGLVEGGRQKLLLREPHKLLLIADGVTPGLL